MSESQMKVTVKGTRLFGMLLLSQQLGRTGATEAREPIKKRFAKVLRQAA